MKRVVLICFLVSLIINVFSQENKIISGTVKNEQQEALEGVTISVIGQNRTVVTNASGSFTIEVSKPETAKLRFTYVGFAPTEIPVHGTTDFNIVLQQSAPNQVDEVAVIAFGTAKKTSITGSVVSVRAQDLKGPTSNLTTTLAGKVPGIIAFQRSGEPGQDNANFFIRGVGTFGAGKQDPLIYIDGIESTPTDLARLNPDNIDNFSVLKDAAATALYGSRGANGVLLLTTKNGEVGQTKINFRFENRLSGNTKTYKLADNITYMRLANEAVLTRDPLGSIPYDPNKIDNTAAGLDPLLYPSNNWMDLLIKPYTHNLAANLDVRGGNEKATYFVSLTYDENNGLLKEASLNNFSTNVKTRAYSILSNIMINFTKSTRANISVRGVFDSNNSPIGGGARIFTLANSANPVAFPILYPQEYLPYAKHPLFGSALTPNSTNILYSNPFATSVSGFQQYSRSQLIPKIEIFQTMDGLTKGLSGRVMAFTQRDANFTIARRTNPFFYQLRQIGDENVLMLLNETTPGQVQVGTPPTEYLTYEPGDKNVSTIVYAEGVLDYRRTFQEKHTIGGRIISTIRSSLNGNATSLQLSLPKRNINLMGQTNYSYKDKYTAEFSFGYNGSERFASGKRFGFFPAFSAAWMISKEDFLADSRVINNLKLRASYGIIGNDQIGEDFDRFFYLSEVSLNATNKSYTFGENYGYYRPGVSTSRYANSEISWERSKQSNIGLEATLFKDLSITLEAYKQVRSSILLTRSNIPTLVGLQAAARANIGEASSKGIDANITYTRYFGTDYWAKLTGNFTYATSNLIFNEQPEYAEGLLHLDRTGKPVNQPYGLIAERLFTDEVEVRNSPQQNFGMYTAGDIKYRDINGDGKISGLDVVPIGLPTVPEIIYGFGGSFGIKRLDISLFFQGSGRSSFMINPNSTRNSAGDVLGISPFVAVGGSQSGLLDVIAQDHWSEDNRNAYAFWPRLSSEVIQNNVQSSTWWMRRGDFLRLKQVELGYNFTPELARKVGLSNLRIYGSALNLFTWSSFKIWDVEMAGNGLGYPLQRVYNLGIKIDL